MLSHKLTFSPESDESFFQGLPPAPAVFLLHGAGEPYVTRTANLRRRLLRLLGIPGGQSKRLNLRDRVREVEFTLTGSEFESQFLLYRILRSTFPKTYGARLRLRPAPLIKLHLENVYPRASVTTRLSAHGSNLFYGPFLSRTAAEKFANDALDLFKMRRCVEELHPDPAFPGCVYSEMKMCLAPCFRGCSDAEYQAEVGRVRAFLDTSGESLARELTEQRDRASADLAYEEAAAIHSRIEKLKPLFAQLPEIVRRIDHLQALIVQPATEPDSVKLFRFGSVAISGPVMFNSGLRADSRSMEAQMEEVIASFPIERTTSAERIEHLAILKRWYYRSKRVGEIFFADQNGSWPWRRIVRGIGRVLKGEKLPESPTFSATPSLAPPS